MIKQWELFEKISVGRTARVMRISLNERGVFSLNQKAFDELGEPKAVELYFDKINKLIGMKTADLASKYSYEIKKQGNNKSYLVRALAFLTYYNIKITGTMVFTDPELEDGYLVLEMAAAKPVTKRKPETANGEQSFALGSTS